MSSSLAKMMLCRSTGIAGDDLAHTLAHGGMPVGKQHATERLALDC